MVIYKKIEHAVKTITKDKKFTNSCVLYLVIMLMGYITLEKLKICKDFSGQAIKAINFLGLIEAYGIATITCGLVFLLVPLAILNYLATYKIIQTCRAKILLYFERFKTGFFLVLLLFALLSFLNLVIVIEGCSSGQDKAEEKKVASTEKTKEEQHQNMSWS